MLEPASYWAASYSLASSCSCWTPCPWRYLGEATVDQYIQIERRFCVIHKKVHNKANFQNNQVTITWSRRCCCSLFLSIKCPFFLLTCVTFNTNIHARARILCKNPQYISAEKLERMTEDVLFAQIYFNWVLRFSISCDHSSLPWSCCRGLSWNIIQCDFAHCVLWLERFFV